MIMAAVALLRSVASKMARAPPTHRRPLLARGIHGGARPGPGGSLTPPPTSNEGKRDRFVVGMAATAGLRFLATKLPRAPPSAHHRLLLRRGLRAASYSTSPPTQMDIRTTHSKVRAGPAYIMIFGLLVYMYGRVLPALNKLNKLEDKLKSRSRKMSNLNDKLTQAMEAIELLLAEDVSEAQSSENGKDHVSVTGKGRLNKIEKTHRHFKELETAIRDLESEITELKDLESEMAKLKIALESARSKENV